MMPNEKKLLEVLVVYKELPSCRIHTQRDCWIHLCLGCSSPTLPPFIPHSYPILLLQTVDLTLHRTLLYVKYQKYTTMFVMNLYSSKASL